MNSLTLTKEDANDMDAHTFLPRIEKPKGLMMKLAYYFTRRQFGKVLTPPGAAMGSHRKGVSIRD